MDHGLQAGSAAVAQATAVVAKDLGLDPVIVRRVNVISLDGPEADARTARYGAFEEVMSELGVVALLLGHTLDDQAETVLLGLTRGAGATSLSGMKSIIGAYRRPLLGLRRSTTVAACADQDLAPWNDPQNDDPHYTRVRIRQSVLPQLEKELGPGVTEALARTAEQLQHDAEVLDNLASEVMPTVVMPVLGDSGVRSATLKISELEKLPVAVLNRVIRRSALDVFGVSLTATHTAAISRLVTDWHGQGEAHLPGIRVERQGGQLRLTSSVTVQPEA